MGNKKSTALKMQFVSASTYTFLVVVSENEQYGERANVLPISLLSSVFVNFGLW
jgi:hypothetical protein